MLGVRLIHKCGLYTSLSLYTVVEILRSEIFCFERLSSYTLQLFSQNWGELPSSSGQVQEFLESLDKFVGILGGARSSLKGR